MVKDHARKKATRAAAAATGLTYTQADNIIRDHDGQALAILEDTTVDAAELDYPAEYCGRCGDFHDDSEGCTCGGCPDCGGGCNGCERGCNPYADCVCEEPAPTTPREEAERAAFNNWTTATTTNRAALAAVHRGLTIFPLPAGGRVPEPGWSSRLFSTPEQVTASWPTGANVGVACGPSKIVVLDIDFNPVHHPGTRSSLAALAAELGEQIPRTFSVDTPSGGQHLYFHAPEGVVVPSSSGGTTPLGRHVDVRAGGGYVLGPWSSVPGTEAEEVSVYLPGDIPGVPVDVAPLPAWILERLTGRSAVA